MDLGRGLTIQGERTSTTSVRALNANFVLDGELSDIDGRAAVATHEKLALTFTGYSGTSATNKILTHNKMNFFIEDATKTNAYVQMYSGYLHLNKGFGVDGTNFSRTFFRQNDGNSADVDRAGTISAIFLQEAGSAYRTQSFIYGNNAAAYSSNSTVLIGGENRSGTVAFGHSNGTTTFTFGMNATQDTKTKATGWTNLAATQTASSVAAAGNFTVSVSSTSGLTAGMLVEGTGIQAGTRIVSVDAANGRVILSKSVATGGVASGATLSFYNLGNTIALANVTNLQVGMAITGTGIQPGTVITAIDTATNTITLSASLTSSVTAATALTFSHAKIVTQGALNKTQNFGEARLYQAEGGTSEFYTSFSDGANFRLDGAVGAITKVGRGTAELMGGTTSSDVNGGINVFGGALVLNYAGKADTFSHVSGASGSNQNNPYQLTLGGGELRLVNQGTAGASNSEYLRGVLTLKAGNSSVVLKPGDAKTLNLHLGLHNAAPQFITVTVDGVPTQVQNPDWYWRAPDRFAGATLQLFADTTTTGSAKVYYSQGAPTGGSITLGQGAILPYATYKYRNGSGEEFVDFAAFVSESGNTRFVDAGGAVAGSASLYNANSGLGTADVTQWNSYVAGSTGYFTDDVLGGANGFSGTITGNLASGGTYNDFVGVRALRFAAEAASGSVVTLGSTTRLVLGSQSVGSSGLVAMDGGAILISNSVGAAGAAINGGYLTSALPSTYFTTGVAANSTTPAAAPTSRDLIIHNYNTEGVFTIGSTIVDYTNNHDASVGLSALTTLNLVVAGPGVTKLTQTANTYSGTTFVSGGGMDAATGKWQVGTLQVPAVNSLGTGSVYLNGGRLRFAHNTTPGTDLGNLTFGASRTLTLGGNGGHIDLVAAGTTLTIAAAIRSEDNVLSGNISATQMSANPGVGDLIKEGAGRLILTNNVAIPTTFASTPNSQQTWNAYYGLTIVKAGALQVNVGAVGDSGILGSNDSSIDGTIVEEGARLDVVMTGGTASGIKEWITLDGGTLGTAATHTDGYVDGVMTITDKGGTLNVGGILRLNLAEGFLTGSGDIIKTGSGQLYLYQNNSEFTGNWDIRDGRVTGITQGSPFGSGSTITLGATSSTSGEAGLFLYANQTFTTKYRVLQDIVVRANAGSQVRSIGARPVGAGRNQDEYVFEGDITLNGDVRFTFEESSTSTATLAPTVGELESAHVSGAYRNLVFNGHIGGTGNISTVMAVTGAGTNGVKATFLLNGNNSATGGPSAWTGSLTVGNTGGINNLQEHYLRVGNDLALTAANKVNLGYNASFQAGGHNVTIGDLKALQTGDAAENKTVVENAANNAGTVRVVQTANTDWDILFRDGVTPEWYSAASAQVYSNRLNLIKDGNGTAVLTQLNTYTGVTTVDKGNLQVGHGGMGDRDSANPVGRTGTGGVQVNGGGTLSGTGVVQGTPSITHLVRSGGVIAPGDTGGSSLGTLFVDGNLTVQSGGTLRLQVAMAYTYFDLGVSDALANQDDPGYDAAVASLSGNSLLSDPVLTDYHDHLEISGQLTIGSGSIIEVVDLNYALNTAMAGDVFNLIDWGSVYAAGFNAGGFRSGGEGAAFDLRLPELSSGLVWDTSLFASDGILVVTAGVVPEPGRAMLLLLGVVGIALRRKRRDQSALHVDETTARKVKSRFVKALMRTAMEE